MTNILLSKKDFLKGNKPAFYFALLHFALVTVFVTVKYYSFSYFDFDLAEQAQSIKQILRGSLYSSILETNFLGNHARFILFFLAPFYLVFNSPLFLLYTQAAFIALSGIVIYRIALLKLSKKWAFLALCIFLLHPATMCALNYEFHTEVLAVLFLSLMILAFLKDNLKHFYINLFFALICKENMALIMIMFGIFAFFKNKSLKWYLPPVVIGFCYFSFYCFYLQPLCSNGNIALSNMYAHLGNGLPEVMLNFIKNPFKALYLSVGSRDLMLVLQLLAPFLFLVVFSPVWLFMLIPIILQHLLSQRSSDHNIIYHYYAVFVPFLSVCFILSLKKMLGLIKKEKVKKFSFISMLLGAVLMCFAVNPTISFLNKPFKNLKNPITNAKYALLNSIPKNSNVCATMEFLPFLLDKENVYSAHYVVSGKYTLTEKEYIQPDDVDFMLIDTNNIILHKNFINKDSHNQLKRFMQSNNLLPVAYYENVILFAKNAGNIKPPMALLEKEIEEPNKEIIFEDKIKLINAEVVYLPNQDAADITLVFETLETPDTNYWIYFKATRDDLKPYDSTYLPLTFLLHPTSIWKKGDTFEIKHRILFDTSFDKGTYYIGFMLFDKKSKKIIISDKNRTLPNTLAKITTAK